MFSSKIIENENIKKKIKLDIRKVINERKKNLKIKIPNYKVFFNLDYDNDDTPKIKHQEIEINR
mgnify:CR=1 FL=1|jgi:hypothetical protein